MSERTGLVVSQVTDEVLYADLFEMQELDELEELEEQGVGGVGALYRPRESTQAPHLNT
jgi:hypothetical protein